MTLVYRKSTSGLMGYTIDVIYNHYMLRLWVIQTQTGPTISMTAILGHSTSGNLFLLGDGAISWLSKRQSVLAVSTAEAEYIALYYSAQEAI